MRTYPTLTNELLIHLIAAVHTNTAINSIAVANLCGVDDEANKAFSDLLQQVHKEEKAFQELVQSVTAL